MTFFSVSVFLLLLSAVMLDCHDQKEQVLRSSVEHPIVGAKDAYSRIEAENADYNFGANTCDTTDDENGRCLCGIDIGESTAHYLVDFGDTRQPVGMAVRVSNAYSANENGIIDVYAKNLYSTPIATFIVPYTSSWENYQTLNTTITKKLYWTQDIIFAYYSSNSESLTDMKYSVCNMNWFAFY